MILPFEKAGVRDGWNLCCGSCEFLELLFIEKQRVHCGQSHLSLELAQ